MTSLYENDISSVSNDSARSAGTALETSGTPSRANRFDELHNRSNRVDAVPASEAAHDHHGMSHREAWKLAHEKFVANGLDPAVVIWLGLIHLSILAAPFCFSWSGLALCIVFHWITGGIGVCLGYHRTLTHSSIKTPNWVRYTLAAIGGLSGEGSALHWTANHRMHHAHSDQPGDPHSPHEGPWWSHILWTTFLRTPEEIEELHSRWIPDLKDDKGLRFLDAMFLPNHIALGLIMGAAGYAIGGWPMFTSFIVWGMFVRLFFVLHSTWFVNSASHMWGYRNYETTDDSRNNWWVALITYGEGWHNNHHAYPRMARHGHRWWEVDMTFLTIKLMEKCGLAWDVVDHQHEKRADLNTIKSPQPDPASSTSTANDTARILAAARQQDSAKTAPDTIEV